MCFAGGYRPFTREMMAEVIKRRAALAEAQDKMQRGPGQTTAQRGPLTPKYAIIGARGRDVVTI